MEIARFARPGGSKVLGCIVYLLLGPLVGVILGAAAGGLAGALAHSLGASEDAATAVGVSLGGLACLGALAWAFRDFRRRAFAEVVVYADAVEVASGKERARAAFSEVRSLDFAWDGSVLTCALRTGAGKRLRLPGAIAPFPSVQPFLEGTLIAGLAGQVGETLERGQPVSLRESGLRAWGRILYGVFLMPMGVLAILSIKSAGKGFDMIRFGRHLVRQGRRGGQGGFVLTREGPVSSRDPFARPAPWEEVRPVAVDEDGIVLETSEGQRLSASIHAENFLPVCRWIQGRLDSARKG